MQPILSFLERVMVLKTVKRAGWQRCGVTPCESVADHAFGVSVLALVTARAAGVDPGKCLALAIVHDLAESIVGDITPADGIPPTEKLRRERDAMNQLAQMLCEPEILELWEEYERGESPEAQLVRDLDAIEMAFQATTYVKGNQLSAPNAKQFLDSARARVTTPIGKRLIQAIDSAEEA